MNTYPPGTMINFYSDRWSFKYETRRYLSPNLEGQDRSRKFGEFGLEPLSDQPELYLFLAPYFRFTHELVKKYPQSKTCEFVSDKGRIIFSAVYLPGGITASITNIKSSFKEAAEDELNTRREASHQNKPSWKRDEIRLTDLIVIAGALERHYKIHDHYPNTNGSIQTLCCYPTLDEGCSLTKLTSISLIDPAGHAQKNGYWYMSNGKRYTVYAQLEVKPHDPSLLCPVKPNHLKHLPFVICIYGP